MTDTDPDTYRLETDKTVCQHCGYVHENSQDCWIHLDSGDYCPKCGTQFEDGDRFTETEIVDLNNTDNG